MKRTTARAAACLLAICFFLVSFTACGNRSDTAARDEAKILARLSEYEDSLDEKSLASLAEQGVYVNTDSASVGESYQYWMLFYNKAVNGVRDTLDIIRTDTDGSQSILYLDYNGSNLYCLEWDLQTKKHKTYLFDTVDDRSTVQGGEKHSSSYAVGEGHSKLLFTERLPSLPAYEYHGGNIYMRAVLKYLANNPHFTLTDSETMIPIPILLATDDSDPDHVVLWGEFWCLNYSLRGSILYNESGEELPMRITLERVGESYVVQSLRKAQDNEHFSKSLRNLCDGDRALYRSFKAVVGDISEEQTAAVRKAYLKDYVQYSGISATAYEDYGWEPISIR